MEASNKKNTAELDIASAFIRYIVSLKTSLENLMNSRASQRDGTKNTQLQPRPLQARPYGIAHCFSLVAIFFCPLVFADTPPSVFIDKGACPFECCTYGEWTVEKDVDLLDEINGRKVVARAKKGEIVRGVTGEVHTIPLKIKVSLDSTSASSSELRDGDEVYLLTYQGEGFWKVWKNGKVIDGVFEREGKERPQSVWWVQIKLKDGKTGWTRRPEDFGNKDACG